MALGGVFAAAFAVGLSREHSASLGVGEVLSWVVFIESANGCLNRWWRARGAPGAVFLGQVHLAIAGAALVGAIACGLIAAVELISQVA